MSEMVPTEAEVVAGLAREADTPKLIDPTQIYVVPDGLRVLDLERYRDTPNRPKGSITLSQAESLHRYVDEHKVFASARSYADVERGSIVVVMNDHESGDGRWGDWRATLQLQPSLGWQRWAGYDGELMPQENFAEHIEEGLLEIVTPSGARMLEIAQSFHATNRATLDSAVRLDSGETQIAYTEVVAAKAGQKRNIAIPQTFELALQPFEGGASFKVKARFRYRVTGPNLLLGYKLERPEDVRRTAFDEVAAFFSQETGVPLFYGTARQPSNG